MQDLRTLSNWWCIIFLSYRFYSNDRFDACEEKHLGHTMVQWICSTKPSSKQCKRDVFKWRLSIWTLLLDKMMFISSQHFDNSYPCISMNKSSQYSSSTFSTSCLIISWVTPAVDLFKFFCFLFLQFVWLSRSLAKIFLYKQVYKTHLYHTLYLLKG